jgi:Mg-chelatase subunit ChlD
MSKTIVGGKRGYARADALPQGPNPGVLTAAVWDDAAHWAQYSRFLDRADTSSWNVWDLDPSCLVTLRGALAPNTPLVLTQGRRSAVVRARADGSARFFPCVEGFRRAAFDVAVDSGSRERVEPNRVESRRDGAELVRLAARSVPAPGRQALDLGFLVDATGSMSDEMRFLQTELQDIVSRVRAPEPELDIRVSVVFYRDRGDAFLTRTLPFTRSVDSAVAFLSSTSADGGGDYPEDMNAGFAEMMRQDWSHDAAPRLLFLLADAPPQRYADERYTYREAVRDAAAGGIAIYPVAASGTDKSTEYLFRAAAVMTGGKYIFLTDDSGVGDHHEEPDISGYTVEKLNDLMVREIRSYVRGYLRAERVADGW